MESTNALLNCLDGISHSITDKILQESFTKVVSSLREAIKKKDEHINRVEEKIRDLGYDLEYLESENRRLKWGKFRISEGELKSENIFGRPLTLEDEMKMELLFEVYRKYSLTQMEEKIGNKYNLTI
jgi:hypothetical protein